VATRNNEFIHDARGRKKAIILPIRQYEQLLEDLHDLAIIAERRDEQPISFEEMKRRLGLDESL
jgi:hypothetical protein